MGSATTTSPALTPPNFILVLELPEGTKVCFNVYRALIALAAPIRRTGPLRGGEVESVQSCQ